MKTSIVAAALFLTAPGVARAQLGIALSTTTEKIQQDAERAREAEGDAQQAALDALFDNSAGGAGKGGVLAVAANAFGGFARAAKGAFSLKGLKVAKVPPLQEILSDLPGKKHGNLDTMQVAPDGTMYRMRRDRPWWKFWDPSKVIESSVPAADGASFNKKGEFVGDWQRVLKTKGHGFEVVADQGGKNVVYTFERKGTGTEIGRDGKYVTTLGGNDLREVKIGKNDKVYARYEKGRVDSIMEFDPTSKVMKQVAKVEAEYKTWEEWIPERGHYEEVGHYEQRPGRYEEDPGYYHDHGEYNHWHDGEKVWVPGENVWVRDGSDWVVDRPGYYEERTSRQGVTKFEVDSTGNVYTLFKGQVANENSQQMLARGNVQQFTVDGRGNLFTVSDNRVAVNNNPGTEPWSSGSEMHADDHGNLYRADGKIARRVNVMPDPSQPVETTATGAAGK